LIGASLHLVGYTARRGLGAT